MRGYRKGRQRERLEKGFEEGETERGVRGRGSGGREGEDGLGEGGAEGEVRGRGSGERKRERRG